MTSTTLPNTSTHASGTLTACPAMVLAAGRGERMRPLTDHCPKPLLNLRGQPLMQWTMQALVRGGCTRLVLNTGWLGEQVQAQWGDDFHEAGQQAAVRYSHEASDFGYALETAGGIARALPLLCEQPSDVFWLAAGDVFVPDFVFDVETMHRFAVSDDLAHLWLVPNPEHNPLGDFGLTAEGRARNLPRASLGHINEHAEVPRYTYSTIALLRGALFNAPWSDIAPGNPQGTAAPLAPLLRRAMDSDRVGATLYTGEWTDVGTPERLQSLNAKQ